MRARILFTSLVLCACQSRERPPPALDEPLSPVEARAGIITRPSELLAGPGAGGRIGDFKIYNSRVAFVIQGIETARGWGPYGGGPIDAARLPPRSASGIDRLQEILPMVGTDLVLLRALRPLRGAVVSDGRSGGPAVVRIEAVDAPLPIFDAALSTTGLSRPLGLAVTIDYVLEPEAELLRVRTTVENRSGVPREVDVVDGIFLGEGLEFLAPGTAVHPRDLTGRSDIPMMIAATPAEVSYAWAAPGRDLQVVFATNEVLPAWAGHLSLAPGQTGTVERILAVGGGDAEEARRIALRATGAMPPSTVRGIVVDPDGLPIADARIDVLRGSQPETFLRSRADDGRFEAAVAPGELTLVARAPGRRAATATVAVPAGEVRLRLSRPSGLRLTILGERHDGTPEGFVPARVEIDALEGGEGGLFYPLPEETAIPLAPGRYRVRVSRGMEYEPAEAEARLGEGELLSLDFTLRRVVDTTGFLAADFHLHASPSADSDLPLADRVRSCAGEGLEFPVATDHDIVTDYRPVIDALGLGRFLGTAPGTETSPLHAHVNGYPLPQTGSYWPVRWWHYDAEGRFVRLWHPTEIFARLRELGARVIQINHARSTTDAIGAMNTVGYDPARGYASVDPAVLSRGFDAYEVMNARRVSAYEAQLVDWFSFLRQGHRVVAVATSDAHGAAGCGHPRTYVQAGDDPAAATGDSVADALLAQRAVATLGPFVSISVANRGLGETAPAPDGEARVRVRVQAPSFVRSLRLAILVDGQEAAVRDLPASGVTRFDGEIPVRISRDAFVVAKVTGDEEMRPVYGSRPFTVTNPVYLDADGDGRYTPPVP